MTSLQCSMESVDLKYKTGMTATTYPYHCLLKEEREVFTTIVVSMHCQETSVGGEMYFYKQFVAIPEVTFSYRVTGKD